MITQEHQALIDAKAKIYNAMVKYDGPDDDDAPVLALIQEFAQAKKALKDYEIKQQPLLRIENPYAYTMPNKKTLKLEVEFCLDMVPGAWHQPEDLMKWIAKHSYVKAVTFDQTQS